jgi:chemotaxis methyl-accepting protein methylase
LKDLPHLAFTPAALFDQPETSSDFLICQSMLIYFERRSESSVLFGLLRCFLGKESGKEVVIP